MQRLFLAHAELAVEGDGRFVLLFALDEDHPAVRFAGDLPHGFDKRRGNAQAPRVRGHGEVIDVDFATRLLELAQAVSTEAAHDPSLGNGRDHDHVGVGQEGTTVIVIRRVAEISVALVERLRENGIQLAQQWQVLRSQPANLGGRHRGQIFTAVPETLTISIEPFWPSTS